MMMFTIVVGSNGDGITLSQSYQAICLSNEIFDNNGFCMSLKTTEQTLLADNRCHGANIGHFTPNNRYIFSITVFSLNIDDQSGSVTSVDSGFGGFGEF